MIQVQKNTLPISQSRRRKWDVLFEVKCLKYTLFVLILFVLILFVLILFVLILPGRGRPRWKVWGQPPSAVPRA